jgi:uncharacterized protein (DUF697 family)
MNNFLARYQATVKEISEGKFDNATDEVRTDAVEDLIRTCCSTAAMTTILQPIPFVDTAVLVPVHVSLIGAIGRLRRDRVPGKVAFEMLGTFRNQLVAQHAMMGGVKFVPYLGEVIAMTVAHALTYSTGHVADVYFLRNRKMAPAEMREMWACRYNEDFERFYRQRRNEIKAMMGRLPAVQRKLQDLDQQYRYGRMSEREKDRLRDEVLYAG